jgi:thiol-disulfide isomerase/thioredoxin
MSDQSRAKPRGGILKWALWGAALLGVAAVVYIIAQAVSTPGQKGGLADLAKGEMAKLVVPTEVAPAPAAAFNGPDGSPTKIADFKGKVVVMNVWATWCAPCVIEMPTLARLQGAYAGKPVEVVAISIDKPEDLSKAQAFIAKHAPLRFYHDPTMRLPFALKPAAAGMPTTVIYGPDGLERGRVAGEADWSGPDAKKVIDAVLAEAG